MIPTTCPCCEALQPPHQSDCTFRADAPDEAAIFDEVSALRVEIAQLREERRWIPVGERLPEDDVPVLVCQQGCEYHVIGWREHRPYDIVPETIWTFGDELDKGYPPEKITHWMPLPTGPESKSNG